MLFRLSLFWGIPVTEIEQTVSARELTDWARYWAKEPWGQQRDNAHAALVATVIANIHRGERQEPFTLNDFMLLDDESHHEKEAQRHKHGAQTLINFLRAASEVKH